MRSVFWVAASLAALLGPAGCRRDSGAGSASGPGSAVAEANQLTCKIGGIQRAFSGKAKVVVDPCDGMILTGFCDANEAEFISIRIPKAQLGRFTLADTPGITVHYSTSMYSSDSRDHYRGGSAEGGTVVEVSVTEIGGPGKPVKGTFSCLVRAGPEGVELRITDGVFSVIRGRPPKKPSIFRWGR